MSASQNGFAGYLSQSRADRSRYPAYRPAHPRQSLPSETAAGFCMSGQVAIGRQFFPQRVVGDTVHSGMALGMPERPATTGPYKAIDRDHESRSRTEEG